MRLKQVSVFLENKPGRMEDMLQALIKGEINIRALCVADTADFGIMRLILSDTEKGLKTLRDEGFTATTTDVIRVRIPDHPGGLLETVARPLARAGINIEYVYAFVERPLEDAVVVLKTDDLEGAIKTLQQHAPEAFDFGGR